MRIGIYADKYRPCTWGGIDQFFVRSTMALAQYNPQHQYIILAQPQNYDILREQFSDTCIHIHQLNQQTIFGKVERLLRRHLPFLQAGERAQINQLDFDVVTFPRQILHVIGLDSPTILTLFDIQHEYLPHLFNEDVLAQRRTSYRRSIKNADHVIVAANFTQKTIIETMPDCGEKVSTVYPGIDDAPSPDETQKQKIRRNYNLPEYFLYYPANPWSHKNHARLFRTLSDIRRHNRKVIPIVLTGRLESVSQTIVHDLLLAAGIEDQVYDLGFVPEDDVKALMATARGLVFPSLFEGFGFPLLEAQMVGCPVVASNSTTIPEIMNGSALLFDPYDIEDMRKTLLEFWENEELREDLVSRGQQNVRHFSWHRYAHEFEKIFA